MRKRRYQRQKQKQNKDNRGMTMVEVLMGFTILILLMGMFSGIISTSSDIFFSAAQLRRAGQELQQAIYREDVTAKAVVEKGTVSLVPDNAPEGDSGKISMSASLYKLDSSTVNSDTDESLQVDVYFLKAKN